MRIGISISQTGPFSMIGMQALNGVQLWVSHLQRKGGLRVGQRLLPVRLITRDDRSRTFLARENIHNLINEDDADVLLGPYSSHLTKAAAEICDTRQKLLWNHGGASDDIHQPNSNWIVSTLSPASRYLEKLPQWIAGNDSAADEYLLLSSPKGTFASNVAAGVRQSAGALRKPVRLRFAELADSTVAFIELLNQAAPKVLVLAGTFEQETNLIRTRAAWPKSIRHVACVSAGIRRFLESVGDFAEGVIGPSQWEPGVDQAPITGPTSWEFVQDFTKSFGAAPDYVAAGAFAAGLMVEECIRRAASIEDATVRDVARELQTGTFYGRFQIDAAGRQMGHETELVRWEKGRKVVVSPRTGGL